MINPKSTYSKSRPSRPESPLLPGPERQSYTVHGEKASSYEYNVALALDKFRLPYLFQVDFLGGRKLRGGLVLDFLVLTVPLPTPVWVNGDYWHSGQAHAEDKLKQAALDRETGGQFRPALTLWGEDCATPEAATRAVRRELL